MGSPVQERGDFEGSPDGQLRDQNGGGRGQSSDSRWVGLACGWGSGLSQVPNPNHMCRCPRM